MQLPLRIQVNSELTHADGKINAAKPKSGSRFDHLHSQNEINGPPEVLEVQPPVVTPQPCSPDPPCAEAKQIGETTKPVKGKQKAKGRPRKTLGDISNNGKEKGAATNTQKNRQVDFKPRVLKKTSLSNGFQVRNLDIQEETLDGLSFNLNKYLKEKGIEGDHVSKPDIAGHDPPNIDQNTVSMICGDSFVNNSGGSPDMGVSIGNEVNSHPPTIIVDSARLKKAMIDVKAGVVGSTSALIEALSSAF
ncbi:uncharacterized protein Pyn_16081 [Prunus yedoensis var. nudiflora]|uniref:Uncharacterized protein n=1 Tax=Prunus yedoensis var. nudiflora TaxID=2094558 RepID=A0A314ZJE6_PRUYE|nr:uncharacterized protein Pyn_16081 [Prunus yedoensis var. nudiflora]